MTRKAHHRRTYRAFKDVEPVMIPLLELFAVVDDVFTEEDAMSALNIHKTTGRVLRQWKETRSSLDPGFNKKDYELRPRRGGLRLDAPD